MENLTVLFDDNGSFTDLSIEVENYTRDTTNVNFVAAEDRLMIGYTKRFSDIYFAMTSYFSGNSLSFKYWNGSAFVDLNVTDFTKNFTRDGFLQWDSQVKDWAENEVDSKERFWIEVTASSDEALDFKGIHTVFCDDNDLKDEYRRIEEFRDPDDTSFIATHQAARKKLIQDLRNQGRAKKAEGKKYYSDIVVWDLLKRDQLRQAACYLALKMIFFNASDNTEGKFMQLSNSYNKAYKNALEVYLLDVDTNDDGTQKGDRRAVTFAEVKML